MTTNDPRWPPPADDDNDDETVAWRPADPADPQATQAWTPGEPPANSAPTLPGTRQAGNEPTWPPPDANLGQIDPHATQAWVPGSGYDPPWPEPPVSPGSSQPTLPGQRNISASQPTIPPPPGTNPRRRTPAPPPILPDDTDLMLRRVPERDPGSTRVQPRTAYTTQAGAATPGSRAVSLAESKRREKQTMRNMWQFIGVATALVIVLGLVVMFILGAWTWWQYQRVARDLPPVAELRDRASTFESTYIYAADGSVVYEINDPTAGRRTYVDLEDISPYVIAATIATEDARFWANLGFDPIAIVRAVWQNYQAGETVSGASTITQQLARALLLSPEERIERTADRKVREIILATQMRATYPADDILELYLNEIYYGNLSYGIEAAAQTYFNKSARDLTLGEATFLAGLPQSPAVYDIYTNRDVTLARQRSVMALLLSSSEGCATGNGGVQVNSTGDRVCITQQEALAGIIEIENRTFNSPRLDVEFPHWALYVRQVLEETYGAAEIYRAGLRVYTTLNPDLQRFAQQQVRDRVINLAGANVTNGAAIVIDPTSGQILALVGSDDYFDPTDGQINMALRPRQPGSSIKPFTYLAAFEQGWTPGTIIWDVPTEFPDGANPPYVPRNYDGRFHGPLTVRDSLANSYNIPAVKALQFVGIYDNPATPDVREGLIPFLEDFGVTTLTSDQYGLALTLGGGEVTLLEWAGAYATLAAGGVRVDVHTITRITTPDGTEICRHPDAPLPREQLLALTPPPCELPPENWGQQVVRPDHAFLISSILSDNAARYLAFGPGNPLETSFPAAVKTGTTNDIRDLWAMGYTPNLVVGVWMGNADNSAMTSNVTSSGTSGAIWNAIMQNAWGILGRNPQPFTPQGGVQQLETCYMTGAALNDYCRNLSNPLFPSRSGVYLEWFAPDALPPGPENDLFVVRTVESFSQKLVGPACEGLPTEEKAFINLTDESALRWLEADPLGQQFAAAYGITFPVALIPKEQCGPNDPRPDLAIQFPASDGETVSGLVDVWGFANVVNGEFDYYQLEYGFGDDPQGWRAFTDTVREPNTNANPRVLGQFNSTEAPDGLVTIRLIVSDRAGHRAEVRRIVNVNNTPSEEPPTSEPATSPPQNTPIPTFTLALPSVTPTFTPAPPTDTPTATLPAPTTEPPPTATETPPPTTEAPPTATLEPTTEPPPSATP